MSRYHVTIEAEGATFWYVVEGTSCIDIAANEQDDFMHILGVCGVTVLPW